MKFINIILALTLLVSISACNTKKTVTPSEPTVSDKQKEILNKGIHFGEKAQKEDPLSKVAESLQPAIDKWLEKGMADKTLNEWGEPFGSEPPTATQLFDSVTKKPSTKYEWIVRRHGDLIMQWSKEQEEAK